MAAARSPRTVLRRSRCLATSLALLPTGRSSSTILFASWTFVVKYVPHQTCLSAANIARVRPDHVTCNVDLCRIENGYCTSDDAGPLEIKRDVLSVENGTDHYGVLEKRGGPNSYPLFSRAGVSIGVRFYQTRLNDTDSSSSRAVQNPWNKMEPRSSYV